MSACGKQLPEKKHFAPPHSDRNLALCYDESSAFGKLSFDRLSACGTFKRTLS